MNPDTSQRAALRPDASLPLNGDRIGITSTVPVEVVFAAGLVPVDLNNLFLLNRDRRAVLDRAERAGIPRACCAWVKGIFGATLEAGLRRLLVLRRGDCSEAESLGELLMDQGLEGTDFAYPGRGDRAGMRRSLEQLTHALGVEWKDVESWYERLQDIRSLVHRLDELTWREDRVDGGENHRWLVATSDFEGDPEGFQTRLSERLTELGTAPLLAQPVRLALLGVPPIVDDLHAFLEERGARVVLNEVSRQFSLPAAAADLVDQYLAYTYPYGAQARLEDILSELPRRRVHGVIHYVQSFCHHQLEDPVFRRHTDLPFLTLEGDRPGPLDPHSRLRVEAFLEQLEEVP